MPNHFLTIGLCARDWDRLDEMGLEDIEQVDLSSLTDANLCERVLPMPADLKGIVASQVPTRYRHKTTGEWWTTDGNGPEDDRDSWERVPLSRNEVLDLQRRFGGATWYEWCPKNWGTKWGTYRTKCTELGGDGSPLLVQFETAWGPPNADCMRLIDEYLCDTYALKNIKWIGHEPYDDSTVDIEVAEPAAVA